MTDSSSQLISNPVASAALAADAFTGATTIENKWLTGTRSGSSGAVLTAGTNPPAAPTGGINGIGPTALDADGSGTLRLTDAATNQGSYAIYNSAISAGSGLNITFDFFSYGGTPFAAGDTSGGDGISFFLIDGATTTPTIGGFGGSLGYANRNPNPTANNPNPAPEAGLTGGYIGIGFDEYGNFINSQEHFDGLSAAPTPNSVGVRGKAADSYKYLTSGVGPAGSKLDNLTGTRATAKRTANIDISTTGKLTVSVDFDGDDKFTSAGEVVISSYDLVTNNGPLPSTFKFGFAASTGGSTNIHEIRNLKVDISTATPTTVIKPDLLWRNTVSTPDKTEIWYIDDTSTPTYAGGGKITYKGAVVNPGKDWQVKATADFGGSSKGDILWRNKVTDQIDIWLMEGTTITAPVTIPFKPGLNWDIVGVGRFKGESGPLGIVWQDSNDGHVDIWEWDFANQKVNLTSGGTGSIKITGGGVATPGSVWKVQGVGDYDGDGVSDLVFRNSNSNAIVVWGIDGTSGLVVKTPYAISQTIGSSFKVVGSGKFDGNSTTDIIFRDDAADRTLIWTLAKNGTTLTATPVEFALKPGSNWRIQGLADFNADGKTDIVWRDTNNSQISIWALDGAGAALLPGNAGTGFVKFTSGVTLVPGADFVVAGINEFGS
jgi:Bacterial lectin